MATAKGQLYKNKPSTKFVADVSWTPFGPTYIGVRCPENPDFWLEIKLPRPQVCKLCGIKEYNLKECQKCKLIHCFDDLDEYNQLICDGLILK